MDEEDRNGARRRIGRSGQMHPVPKFMQDDLQGLPLSRLRIVCSSEATVQCDFIYCLNRLTVFALQSEPSSQL